MSGRYIDKLLNQQKYVSTESHGQSDLDSEQDIEQDLAHESDQDLDYDPGESPRDPGSESSDPEWSPEADVKVKLFMTRIMLKYVHRPFSFLCQLEEMQHAHASFMFFGICNLCRQQGRVTYQNKKFDLTLLLFIMAVLGSIELKK